MELKELNKRIKAIATKTAKWRDDVQLALVGCAYQAFEHGNVDPATRIVKVLSGADAKALVKWIETHMPAIWVKSEVQFRVNKSFKGEYDAVTLMSEPWWELAVKPRDINSTINVLECVRDLIKRIEREAKAGTKTIEHAELVETLKQVAGKAAQAE